MMHHPPSGKDPARFVRRLIARAPLGCFDKNVTEPGDSNPTDPRDPLVAASWHGEPNVCGSCIAWRPEDARPDETVAAGTCRLRRELARVPATLRKCDLYKGRGKFVYTPSRPAPERRRNKAAGVRIMKRDETSGELVTTQAPIPIRRGEPRVRPEVPRVVDMGTDDRGLVRSVFTEVLRSQTFEGGRAIQGRFEGGTVKIVAASGKSKQVSAKRFFGLLEDFRGSLEALEDQLVGKDALLDQFTELQKNIRGIRGTMTTFNFMYEDRGDYFTGKE